ncbi:MAG: hypothetical protein ABIL89_03100 [candidate division WOR-3 bacterium]
MKVKIKFENFESEVELSEKEVQIREALKFGYERKRPFLIKEN